MCDFPFEEMIQKGVSIRALRRESREIISTLLNPKKIILSNQKKLRYWPGLAELCGIGGEEFPNIQGSRDPCARVLELWYERDKGGSTIEKLLSFLEVLDRFDVIDDLTPLLENDIEIFKKKPKGFIVDTPVMDDKGIVGINDARRCVQGLPAEIYDALVLFADEDFVFAQRLIDTMEKFYNLKIFFKDRDLLGGLIEHDSIVQLISDHCKRLVVIISPSFFDSPANEYFCRFAQVLGIENRNRKLIQVLYRPCKIPLQDLRMYFSLDYERTAKFGNFWDKLYYSIKTTKYVEDNTVLKNSMETVLPKNQENFRNTINLTITNARNSNFSIEENISPSPSDNSSELYLKGLKRKDSFYKRVLKKINKKKYTR